MSKRAKRVYSVPVTADPERVYALRRTLVGRLQAASRGVSRRGRIELFRRFAAEWGAVQSESQWLVLEEAIRDSERENLPEERGAGSFLVYLGLGGKEIETFVARRPLGLAFSEVPAESARNLAGSITPSAMPRPSEADGGPQEKQVDLFASGLFPQPA